MPTRASLPRRLPCRIARPSGHRAVRALGVAGAVVLTLVAGLGAIAGAGGPAGAQTSTTLAVDTGGSADRGGATPFVDIIEVSGYVDGVMANFIADSLDKAAADGAQAIVIQLDSPGSVLSDAKLEALGRRIEAEGRLPVTLWIGPTKARARGGAVRLVRAAAKVGLVGMAPGTKVGDAPDGDPLAGRVLDQKRALAEKVATNDSPVLGDFVVRLDGRTLGGRTMDTAEQIVRDGRPLLRPYGVRFAKLSFTPRVLHTVTNPSVAYLLLLIGLALMVFEFYTGGVGVAASVGIGAFALASYGLGNLPTRPIGLALLGLAMFGFAVDVQAGTPRFWTGVGSVALVLGSLTLYGNGEHVPLYWVVIMAVLMVLFMVNGMPGMVRTRFATPTIGREEMVGQLGEARDPIAPEGVVTVDGAPWRARTNRATPIAAGGSVRVVAIDGFVLEVEPLEGAARDHREGRGRRARAGAPDGPPDGHEPAD